MILDKFCMAISLGCGFYAFGFMSYFNSISFGLGLVRFIAYYLREPLQWVFTPCVCVDGGVTAWWV